MVWETGCEASTRESWTSAPAIAVCCGSWTKPIRVPVSDWV